MSLQELDIKYSVPVNTVFIILTGVYNLFIVDKKIRTMCENGELIIENYSPENIGAISYDLTVQNILVSNDADDIEPRKSFELSPHQTVFVETLETIHVPDNFVGIVTEKNSVMRQGLVVSAPYYQPGHKTRCFIRVTNISSDIITISKGKKIAQILFDELSEKPEKTYSQRADTSYNNEMTYTGFGRYEDEYKKELKKIKKAEENLEEKTNNIYANVLTFMGIISAIFSILTINFEAFSNQEFSKLNILSLNLSMAFIISVLMGIILFFINKKRKTWVYVLFAVFVIALLAVNLCICSV